MADLKSCVFCSIARGDVPCVKILETPKALVFLDIAPLAEGHLLLIPKEHYAALEEVPRQALGEVAALLPRLVRVARALPGVAGCNVLQNNGAVAGQAVQHVHFHVIPRREGDGLGYRWNPQRYQGDRAAQLGQQLRDALSAP
jgi:histidine triad (HIT) family protein